VAIGGSITDFWYPEEIVETFSHQTISTHSFGKNGGA
jgi:hypothetical protein